MHLIPVPFRQGLDFSREPVAARRLSPWPESAAGGVGARRRTRPSPEAVGNLTVNWHSDAREPDRVQQLPSARTLRDIRAAHPDAADKDALRERMDRLISIRNGGREVDRRQTASVAISGARFVNSPWGTVVRWTNAPRHGGSGRIRARLFPINQPIRPGGGPSADWVGSVRGRPALRARGTDPVRSGVCRRGRGGPGHRRGGR